MPVNEKILFRSFQYLFSLKSIIHAILSSAMLCENHVVFLGKKYRFPRGGGINIRFRPKYRPLCGRLRNLKVIKIKLNTVLKKTFIYSFLLDSDLISLPGTVLTVPVLF
jgi:hypothetical protein